MFIHSFIYISTSYECSIVTYRSRWNRCGVI